MIALALCLVFICSTQAYVVQPWAGNDGCNDPNYWCKNNETATECGVLEYCKIEWGKTQTTDFTFSKFSKTKLDASPVKVALYYESLCPGCRNFIQTQLFPTFQKLDSSGILDIELVPYGNAQERPVGSKWNYYCQHGANECYGNLIESCALHYLEKQSVFMPFIACLEYYGPTKTNAQYCAGLHKIDYTQIDTCVGSDEGNLLEHQMALKTYALSPPHQYVPWITLNGVHTDAIQTALQTNMLQYVCSVYQGTKPAACSSAEKHPQDVCYKN